MIINKLLQTVLGI